MSTVELQVGTQTGLAVHRFDVVEGVSRLFDVHVVARSTDPALDLQPLLGAEASLSVQWDQPAGRRRWSGVVARAEQSRAVTGGAAEELTEYRFHLVPRMWLATKNANHRIFQHLSVPEIVEEVLAGHGPLEMKVDRAAHPKHEYRVQYGESDFRFACRLMEEAGISYALLDASGTTTFVCGDALTTSALASHAPVTFDATPAVQEAKPRVRDVQLAASHRPDRRVITDYDFRNPGLAFHASAHAPRRLPGEQEVHEYRPGGAIVERPATGATVTPSADDKGFARTDRAYADVHAERSLEADRAGRLEVLFESNQIDLAAGSVFRIEHHPHPMLNDDVLVLRTEVHGEVPLAMRVVHVGVSASEPFRTPRETERPRVTGMQSARVTGPAGEEIHVDEHGRVRVHFPWDRAGQPDDRSSCWMRVAEGWAGVGFGMIALPRIGQEVLVAFLEGDPDRPVVVGRMYNELNPVPYKLPANKTISAWRTSSSPASGGYNELKFEDKSERELIYLRAQRDRHELVRRDQRTRIERKHHLTTVSDEHRVVKEVQRELVLGDSHLHVVGDHREKLDAKRSTTVGSDWDVRVGTKWAVEAGDEIHLKAGARLVIEAGSRLTLKGPGGFVDLHAGGVDIVGELVRINSGGSPGDGSGASPAAPEDAEEAEPMDVSVD